MSLRPRQDFAGRVSIAQSRMAPGGRRWSESPIPRPARRRVRQVGQAVEEPPPPGFLWPMDDASWPFLEASGGPFLEASGGAELYYQVPGIAPGSSVAAAIHSGALSLWGTLPPDEDGWITLDLWFSGVSTSRLGDPPMNDTGGSILFGSHNWNTGHARARLYVNWNPDPYFRMLGSGVGEDLGSSIVGITSEPVHLQMGWQMGQGVVIRWNGSTVHSKSGAFTWEPDTFEFAINRLGAWDANTTVDQVRVYAGPPEGM